MPRSVRTSLALLFLLVLPLAGHVAVRHVHEHPAPVGGGVGSSHSCDCTTETAASRSAAEGRTSGDEDDPLCPVCELAKSMHAVGLTDLPVVPDPQRVHSVVPSIETRTVANPGIPSASRSPPILALSA